MYQEVWVSGKINKIVYKYLIGCKEKEKEYEYGGLRTAKKAEEDLKKEGHNIPKNTINLAFRDLLDTGLAEVLRPWEIKEKCMEHECHGNKAVKCFDRNRCNKNVYSIPTMESIDLGSSHSGHKRPLSYRSLEP